MKFLGYVIANGSEEFLAHFRTQADSSAMVWAKIPDFAFPFSTLRAAQSAVHEIDVSYKVWILSLFESETQYLVSTDQEDKPSWLF
jgi:hypothetical protein